MYYREYTEGSKGNFSISAMSWHVDSPPKMCTPPLGQETPSRPPSSRPLSELHSVLSW